MKSTAVKGFEIGVEISGRLLQLSQIISLKYERSGIYLRFNKQSPLVSECCSPISSMN